MSIYTQPADELYKDLDQFYVYAYLREDGTPYYIGKGSGYRAYVQHRKNNKGIQTLADKSRIVLLEQNLTEIGALALERRYIKWYGRKDNKTGILRNLTNGGEGATGSIPWNKGISATEEHRTNMSIALKGYTKGIPKSDIQRKKQSNSMKGKNTEAKPQISCPHCAKIGGLPQMKQWHFEKCKYLLVN